MDHPAAGRDSESMRGLIAVLSLVGSLLMGGPATAAVPDYQRVINSRFTDAALVDSAGCIRTELFVSSSDNVFGGHPGPVNKQGLTSILVRRLDTCAGATESGPGAAAAPPPAGTVIFDGIGQTLDPLESTARFERAWIDAVLPVLDEVSGQTVPVHLDLVWTLVGEFDRDTVHSHVRVPHGAIVNSHSQTLMGDALVGGTVTIGSEALEFGPTEGAHLQQVKYGCQVVSHPQGDADLDC